MSLTQKEKQKRFREKLKTKGADGFADGPQPWELWDESGIQGDNHIWEGTAKRIYPKNSSKPGRGERLLSGLAMVALASLVTGVAGVYFSAPSTPQQASSKIQPAPIVASRQSIATSDPDETTAQLDTLPSPAAGISPALQEPLTVLPPTMMETRTDRRTHPLVETNSVDRVSVETVITESAVTTTVTTHQQSQQQPDVVATIATTAPPYTHESTVESKPAVTAISAAVRDAQTAAIEPIVSEQGQASATEPLVVEQAVIPLPEHTDATAADPIIPAQTDFTVTQAITNEQAEAPAIEQDSVDKTATITPEAAATEALVVAQTDPAVIEPVVIELPEETAHEAVVVAEPLTTVAAKTTESGVETAPDISREPETATPVPALPVTASGNWVINLSSYTRLSTAERMLAVFKHKGVAAEVFTTTVNDKPMHRIRVAGFASSRSAKAEISTLQQQLGLNDAWVSRR